MLNIEFRIDLYYLLIFKTFHNRMIQNNENQWKGDSIFQFR